jgi:hypothetical protein
VLSLCAGEGRDILPVLAETPDTNRPALVLVELDAELASSASERARAAEVTAQVIVGDAGRSTTWREHLPADLLMLCGIFGNISDADIRTTVTASPSMLTPGGAVIWTRGAFGEVDLRPQIRQWFVEAGFEELGFEAEPHGYGVGVARIREPVPASPVPEQLFTFTR